MSNLRSDCRDLVKDQPAGDVWRTHIELLCFQIDEIEERWHKANQRIKAIRDDLENIVCTEGEDKGIILKSDDSLTHIEEINGRKVTVYDNPYFSDLGEALIAAYEKCVIE
jgi:hypothetical protein